MDDKRSSITTLSRRVSIANNTAAKINSSVTASIALVTYQEIHYIQKSRRTSHKLQGVASSVMMKDGIMILGLRMRKDLTGTIPKYLINRYFGWYATEYKNNSAWYQHQADVGQHPATMIISCCDSRVNAELLFGGEAGEFFVHRNIANLVPPYNLDGNHHGTSAAIEYAVTALKVAHIVVLGHSACGGINGGYHMCNGTEKHLYEDTIYVKKWLEILHPAFESLERDRDVNTQIKDLEKLSIIVSLENLRSFPFVERAREHGKITLHGLWHDIGSGQMEVYDPASKQFHFLQD